MKTNSRIGFFGFNFLGSGLCNIISKPPSFEASILMIALKDKTKPRNLYINIFNFNKFNILHNPEINVVVPLIQ
jgi:hypothetical protein